MNNKLKTAFTLVELLVVIAIIGILSGLIIVGMSSSTNSAKIAKAQIFASSVRDSMLMNLVSEWKFDGSGITDGSAVTAGTTYLQDTWGSENATIGVDPLVYSGSNCIYGSCLNFNGSTQYLSIADDPVFNFGAQMTALLWVKGAPGSGTSQACMGQYRTDNNRSWYIRKTTASPYNKFDIVLSSGGDGTTTYVYSSNGTVFDNNWHLIGFTFSGGNYKMYIDGNVDASSTSPATSLFNSVGVLTFGATADIAYFYAGYIDEVRLYNNVIPTSQIREQYYAGLNRLLAKADISKNEYINNLLFKVAVR